MMSCSTSKMHHLDLQLQTTLMATTTFSHLTQASLCFFPPHKFVPSLLNSLLHYNRRSLQLSCSSLSSKDSVQNLRVVFAGGGTGSNVYPAVAIAEELKTSNPACEFLFFGSSNSIESTAVTSAGYNFAPVPSLCFSPVSSITLFQLCSSPYRFVKSLIQCSRHLRDFKPHIVVGTGGYVSFPVCLAAKINNIMVVIHEPNSAPGFVNSVLALFAHKIFVAFNSTVDSFPRNKCVVCGNPVRLSLRNPVSKAAARSHFFPGYGDSSDSEKDKVLLVLGGSLGANAVNIAMLNLYNQMLRQNNGLYIIWQTGVETYDEMDSLVKNHPRLYLTP